jgi:hypothetical protein
MGCACNRREPEPEIEIVEKVKITHRHHHSPYKWIIGFFILVLIIVGLYMFINRDNEIDLVLAPRGHIRGRLDDYNVQLPNFNN